MAFFLGGGIVIGFEVVGDSGGCKPVCDIFVARADKRRTATFDLANF